MTLGERIRKRRQELGWSQRELAQRIGTRQATIADLERGAQKETSTALIRRLGRSMGVTSDWLIGMYDDDETHLKPARTALGGTAPSPHPASPRRSRLASDVRCGATPAREAGGVCRSGGTAL
jgi:transcriptional regulator with XRE-family HTH domain